MHYTKLERAGNVSLRMPDGEFYVLHDEHTATAREAKRLFMEGRLDVSTYAKAVRLLNTCSDKSFCFATKHLLSSAKL